MTDSPNVDRVLVAAFRDSPNELKVVSPNVESDVVAALNEDANC